MLGFGSLKAIAHHVLLKTEFQMWCLNGRRHGVPCLQKGEHYHIDDGYDAMNNVYACGLLEDINIEPEQVSS